MNLNIFVTVLEIRETHKMKLYSVSDGPPSLACRMLLKALDIDYELIDVDFGKGEHMTKEYEEVYD